MYNTTIVRDGATAAVKSSIIRRYDAQSPPPSPQPTPHGIATECSGGSRERSRRRPVTQKLEC